MDEIKFITNQINGPMMKLADGSYAITPNLQVGQSLDLLQILQFDGNGKNFYDFFTPSTKGSAYQKKQEFSSLALSWKIIPKNIAFVPLDPPGEQIAIIDETGKLTIKYEGSFDIEVSFREDIASQWNKNFPQFAVTNIENSIPYKGPKIGAVSDPAGMWQAAKNLVNEGLEYVQENLGDHADSLSAFLTRISIGADAGLSSIGKLAVDLLRQVDPVLANLAEKELEKLKQAGQEGSKSGVLGAFLGILNDVPIAGPAIAAIDSLIGGAVGLFSAIGSSITSLSTNLVEYALSKADQFVKNITGNATLKSIAASILGIDVKVIDKVLAVIQKVKDIPEKIRSGDLSEISNAIKDTLVEAGVPASQIEEKVESYKNSLLSFVGGSLSNILFGSIKGGVIVKDFRMISPTVGLLTITNPKIPANNIQVTSIEIENPVIVKDGSTAQEPFDFEKVEIISGGSGSDTDESSVELDTDIKPGNSPTVIQITFKNPKPEQGNVKIEATYNYEGLPAEKQIQNGVSIDVYMIKPGSDESDALVHTSNTPGSNQKDATPTALQDIENVYAKTAENFAKAQSAKETAELAGGQALKDAEAKLEEARKKLNEVKKKLDEQVAEIERNKKWIEDLQKKTFLETVNNIKDYDKLPDAIKNTLAATGTSIGITSEDLKKYIDTADKVTKVADLLGKNNPLWKNLSDWQKQGLADRLRTLPLIINNSINILNQYNEILENKADPIKGANVDLVAEINKIKDEFRDQLLEKVKDSDFVKKTLSGGYATIDAFGIGAGILPDFTIKNEGERKKEWRERITNFLKAQKKIQELQQKREEIRNRIVKEVNAQREKAKNNKNTGNDNKSPIKDGNKKKNEEKKINRPIRGNKKPEKTYSRITGVNDKIYRIDPIVGDSNVGSPGTTNPIQIKELSREVTIIPVPEMVFYEDEFRTHYENLGITPDTIQDIYDNAEEIIKDPILDLKDAIESGDVGAVKGFIDPNTEPVDSTNETGGTDVIVIPPATGGTGGIGIQEGVTGVREFEEGEDGKDYGIYVIYADETKTKFSVDGATLETPFLYGIYRYILCSNDTPETSKSRAKANILKFKDELTKKYFIQSSDEYIGDDSCPNDEIQIRLIPSVAPDGTIQLKREASEKKIRTGITEAERTYIDSSGKIREIPQGLDITPGSSTSYVWRDKLGIQQPLPFIYPEDEENVIVYDPSLFETKDPQNDLQKSVRERIQYLLQTGGISASRISFDILADGSIVWDGEVKINKKGLTGDGKIPLNFAIVNGKFDCSGLDLTTLENSPRLVYGEFNCSNNKLITLEKGPDGVVAFIADNNPLGDGTGLKHGPQMIIGWPVGTIVNGPNGYIYSCENCKLENFNENAIVTFGQGGINFRKNKLKSFEGISDTLSEGVTGLDISYNDFESLEGLPPIIPAIAYDENWVDYESKAFYRDPRNRGLGDIGFGETIFKKKTTSTINNFVTETSNKRKNLMKPGTGVSKDLKITTWVAGTKLPQSDTNPDIAQKPRASKEEIQQIIKKAKNIDKIYEWHYPIIVAIRNYFSGLPNSRGQYKDAIFLLTGPNEMHAYNANTFPQSKGIENKETGQTFPVLQPGNYIYTLGKHNGQTYLVDFPALVQPSIMNKKLKIENKIIRQLVIDAYKAQLKTPKNELATVLSYFLPNVNDQNPNEAVRQIKENMINLYGDVFFASMRLAERFPAAPSITGLLSKFIEIYGTPKLKELFGNGTEFELPTAPFVFIRDGQSNSFIDPFGVVQTNLHPGSFTETFSRGCQTIPYANFDPKTKKVKSLKHDQWSDFYKRAKTAIEKRNLRINNDLGSDSNMYNSIEYILVQTPFKSLPQKSSPLPGPVNPNQAPQITVYPTGVEEIKRFIRRGIQE